MRTVALILLSASAVLAQYPIGANALRWNGINPAGPFCWGFSCTPVTAVLVRGETGSLLVRGEWQQPYLLGLSSSATRCLSVTGVYHQLVLDDPITLFWSGTCSTGSPILSCPSGTDSIPITIPLSWPPGLSFSIQGVTGVAASPGVMAVSFTQPLTFVVQ